MYELHIVHTVRLYWDIARDTVFVIVYDSPDPYIMFFGRFSSQAN